MNEEIMPRLVAMNYIKPGLEFKYANRVEMSNKDKISLYSFITDKYEVSPDEIEKEFGIVVGKQFNNVTGAMTGGSPHVGGRSSNDRGIMSDEEYYRRYGRRRGERPSDVTNFLLEEG